MVDLRQDMPRVLEILLEGLESFGREHSTRSVATVAIYCCPWAGWLTLALDTREHSDEHVARWMPNYAARGLEWDGKDESGVFCDNAPDFAFPGWRDAALEHWRTEYEGTSRVIVGLDGRTERPSTANEQYNQLFYRALVSTVKSARHDLAMGSFTRAEPFRCGVQMLDSTLVSYWVVQP